MNYERPVIKTDPNSTLRNRNMTVKAQEVKPNNVMKTRAVETKVANNKGFDFDNVDPNNQDDVLEWIEVNWGKNQNIDLLGFNIIKIDKKSNTIELWDKKEKKRVKRSLPAFVKAVGNAIKNETGDNKIDGNVVNNEKILEMIEGDIKRKRNINGREILRVDLENNVVVLRGQGVLGLEERVPIDEFIEFYKKYRKIGAFNDPILNEQQIQQDERQRNLEDMTEAFRTALGIKPPKVKYFAPLKIHRGISQLPNNYRDYNFHWTDEEIKQVHRLGKTPNPNRKVDGQLHDTFNPVAPQPEPARDFVATREIGYMSKESQRNA